MSAELPKLDGHFDGIANDHAQGWIYSPDAPRTRLEVELVSEDRVVARGIANGFRKSLLDAGIGDGKHGFSIPLPASICDGGAHHLIMREAYTGQVLAGGEKAFQSQAPAGEVATSVNGVDARLQIGGHGEAGQGGIVAPAAQAVHQPVTPALGQPAASEITASAPSHRLQGSFDDVVQGRAVGWVFSPDAPGTRFEVEVVCGDRVVARGIADVVRDDLARAGLGDGRCGFDLPIDPALCSGPSPELYVREAYSGRALEGGPRSLSAPVTATVITPDTPVGMPEGTDNVSPPLRAVARSGALTIEGHFDDVVDGKAEGWVYSPQQPDRRAQVEIVCDERVVARGAASLLRPDLRDAGIGDGRCAFSLAIDPALFDGKAHKVSAREVSSGLVLKGSPREIHGDAREGAPPAASLAGRGTEQGSATAAGLAQPDETVGAPSPGTQTSTPVESRGRPPAEPETHPRGTIWDTAAAHELESTPSGRAAQSAGEMSQAASEQPRLQGRLEAIRHGHLEGWVLDPVDSQRRLELEIMCDGQLQGRCAADLYRPDLAEAGIGDGRHAFSFPLRTTLLDGQPHEFVAREVESGQSLEGSPLEVGAPVRAPAPASSPAVAPTTDRPIDAASVVITEVAPADADGELAGRFESVATGRATGWAFDRSSPGRAVEIEVLCDDRVVAQGIADRYRVDLERAGQGDGRCGFELELDPALLDGQPHDLVARAAQRGIILDGGPLVVEFVPEEIDAPVPEVDTVPTELPVPAAPALQGRFEGVVNAQVCGWVLDPLRPEVRVEVEILCDGRLLARARADLEREDLSEVTIGDGRHGFRHALDGALFDGKAHELSVRAAQTQELLPGSPHWLTSDSPPARVRPADVQGAFEAITGTRATGHAWDITRPEHRLEVEVLREGEVVSRAVANTFRRDLYDAGIGDGRHAFAAPLSYELFDGDPHWLTAREAYTGKSLTHGPHLFEHAKTNWPFDLMPRAEGLKQLEALVSDPTIVAGGIDADWCRRRFLDGCLRQEMRQTESARVIYQELIDHLGENALCHCKLAETWLLDGEPDAALDDYRRAASLPLSLHWAHLGMGNALKSREQYVEAEDAYLSALRLQARDPRTLARIGEVAARAVPMRVERLVADGKLDEAVRLLKSRLIEEPENPMILKKLTSLLARRDGRPVDDQPGEHAEVEAFDASLRVLDLLLADDPALSREDSQ